MKSTDQLLQHFGYTDDWLHLGVVMPSDLQEQFAEFERSEDKNKEHYRCRAFCRYLERLHSISDELLDRLLHLSDCGSDGCDLTLNRAFDLVLSGLLTNSQLQVLAERPQCEEHRSFAIAIARLLLERRIDAEGLSDSIFREIRNLNDATVLRRLLDRDDITREHVFWVAENGCNKPLRNEAKQMLVSRRFHDGG